MKKSNLAKLLTFALATGMSLTSCGAGQAKLVGTYQTEHIATLAQGESQDGSDGDNWQTMMNAKLYADKTYEFQFYYTFGVFNFPFNYGRNITSWGKYTIESEDADLGTKVIKLEMPTAVELVVTHRNATKIIIDSTNWPQVDADEDGNIDPVEYVLMERASTETWENAADFVASYGRAYTLDVNSVGEITKVTIDSHDGKQIVMNNAVANVNAK